jgi:hypothetical protein
MRSHIIAVSLVLASITACAAPTQVNGFKINAFLWKDAQEKVASRATFDMKCPKPQLELTVLQVGANTDFTGGKDPTQVGVTGCGQSIVYVETPSGWVANAMSESRETHTTSATQ